MHLFKSWVMPCCFGISGTCWLYTYAMGTGVSKVMGIYKHALLTLGLGRAGCVGSVQAHAYLYICSDHKHGISCAGGAGS